MSARTPHLSDSRLLVLLEEGVTDPHLDVCPACRARFETWQRLPTLVETAADDAFHQAFPQARVEASRRRILEAVAEQRGARVVPFPGVSGTSTPPPRVRRHPRWMTAAAAGLILGVLLGRWTHPARPSPARPAVAAHVSAPHPAVEPVRYPAISDDELLRDLETLRSGPVAAVRTLHELTPQADAHDTLW